MAPCRKFPKFAVPRMRVRTLGRREDSREDTNFANLTTFGQADSVVEGFRAAL